MSDPKLIDHFKPQVVNTCLALIDRAIPIDLGPEKGGVLQPVDSRFQEICEVGMLVGVWVQPKMYPTRPVGIWSPKHIHTIKNYAEKRGLETVARLQTDSPDWGLELLGIRGSQIVFGLNHPIGEFAEESVLLFGLDHEWGHIRDRKWIRCNNPKLEEVLTNQRGSAAEIVELIETYLKLIREKVPKSEVEEFDTIAQQIFREFQDEKYLSNVLSILVEIIRMGEEIHDLRLEGYLLNPLGTHFRKGLSQGRRDSLAVKTTGGQKIDVRGLSYLARLQEAGLWEKFKRLPDFDPETVDKFDPKLVEFFRTCIRAAAELQASEGQCPNPQK